MKNLARHIEYLLRDNDCVILPGFGGFIAHVVPAYYVGEDNLFYPPSRSISFNTSITMNDGLLIQSYMKSYNVDYAKATYLVDLAIEKLRDTLDEEGSITLPHIGTIKQDIHQAIQFIAEPTGISSPLHFGLGAFTISTLAQMQSQSGEEAQQPKSVITQTERTIDVHIQKKTLRQIVSTAAIFLLLLMVTLPAGDLKPTDIASLHLTDIIYEPKANNTASPCSLPTDTIAESMQDTIIEVEENLVVAEVAKPEDETRAELEVIVEPKTISEANIEASEETEEIEATETIEASQANEATNIVKQPTTISEPTEVVVQPTEVNEPTIATSNVEEAKAIQPVSNKVYHVIVASLPNHRGAEEIIESYKSKGYSQASLVERDNRVRISLVNFTDKNEANNYLKTLRENEAFENAWLLPVNN